MARRRSRWSTPRTASDAETEVRNVSVSGSKAKSRSRQPAGKGARTGAVRPSRAQIRAAEARAAQTGHGTPLDPMEGGGVAETAMESGRAGRARPVRAGARVVARPIALSRGEEYRHVRNDLRRLLVTGGSLLAFMLVLLAIIER